MRPLGQAFQSFLPILRRQHRIALHSQPCHQSTAYGRIIVHNADVMLSGLGTRADVTVNGRLDVTLIGPAILWYSGDTTLGSVSEGKGSMLRERQ